MPLIEVVAALPELEKRHGGAGRVLVVIDQLRATTTIAAAIGAGVEAIHPYNTIAAAREAYGTLGRPDDILMGEAGALAPAGFGLGNSPGPFLDQPRKYAGRSAFMVTTNGTPALAAAAATEPTILFTAAVINRAAVAAVIATAFGGCGVTILCAGLYGKASADDLLASGALIMALAGSDAGYRPTGDLSQISMALFRDAVHSSSLEASLRQHQGGLNLIALGLDADIKAAAQLDLLNVIPMFDGRLIRAWDSSSKKMEKGR